MGVIKPLMLAAPLSLLIAAPLAAEPTEFKIDPDHFSISFAINHLGFASVLGFFTEAEGSFVYDEKTGKLSKGKVVVQSDSVFTNHEERDQHLRKADFLNSRQYPEIVFTLTEFHRQSEGAGTLTGNLTMLGQTHPVSLDVRLNKTGIYPFGHEEYTLGLSATTTIQRSQWGMTYGLEPQMVGDDVNLRFEFEAYDDSGLF